MPYINFLYHKRMKLSIVLWLVVGQVVHASLPFFSTYTNSEDVYAINGLYDALGSPPLSGWSGYGGDPCSESWQGIQCLGNSITTIVLVGFNIGGKLGDSLANFTSINILNLSNNNIGGDIPENWPSALQNLSLSGNMLTGRLSDSFQPMTRLVNLDLSANKLSGNLPTSLQNLTSLATLHLQNNELSGTLDVLQNLPLKELNVANNQFSGSIPTKLLTIPNFQSGGNHLNVTISPSSSPSIDNPPQQPHNASPPLSDPPSTSLKPLYHKKKASAQKAIVYAVAIACSLVILMLLARFIVSHLKDTKSAKNNNYFCSNKPHFANTTISSTKISREFAEKSREEKVNLEDEISLPIDDATQINPVEIVINPQIQNIPSFSQAFSVASLQQYTNNFSDDNLIKESSFGKVYLAEHQDRKLYAVLKIDMKIAIDDFMTMVVCISEVKHHNIVELVGYCAEYEQRLLVYTYFSETTLHDILHSHNESTTSVLSWNSRVRVALKVARVLQHLQEGAKKQVIHWRCETSNILLDDDLDVGAFGCGLASCLSESEPRSYCPRALSYNGPEVTESGLWSDKSDVYSFGVVMLELLTGREPYDSSCPRAERHLVRWAASRLHDIDELVKMVDVSLAGKFSIRSLSRIADIISRCIQQIPEFRPSMSEVAQDLSLALDEASKSIN